MKDINAEDLATQVRKFADDYSQASGISLVHPADELEAILRTPTSADERVRAIDKWVESNPGLEPLQEFLFDLVVLQEILKDREGDYLDSPEWEEFEEMHIDRGTELLNFLIYLKDCAENEIDPSMEDFLYEFLLVEDEDFQDEFFIYESFIRNINLLNGTAEKIIQTGKEQEESELKDLFIPAFLFFRDMNTDSSTLTALRSAFPGDGLAASLYMLLNRFHEIG